MCACACVCVCGGGGEASSVSFFLLQVDTHTHTHTPGSESIDRFAVQAGKLGGVSKNGPSPNGSSLMNGTLT